MSWLSELFRRNLCLKWYWSPSPPGVEERKLKESFLCLARPLPSSHPSQCSSWLPILAGGVDKPPSVKPRLPLLCVLAVNLPIRPDIHPEEMGLAPAGKAKSSSTLPSPPPGTSGPVKALWSLISHLKVSLLVFPKELVCSSQGDVSFQLVDPPLGTFEQPPWNSPEAGWSCGGNKIALGSPRRSWITHDPRWLKAVASFSGQSRSGD